MIQNNENESLRRQVELLVNENRRLKAKFAVEKQELQDQLTILFSELQGLSESVKIGIAQSQTQAENPQAMLQSCSPTLQQTQKKESQSQTNVTETVERASQCELLVVPIPIDLQSPLQVHDKSGLVSSPIARQTKEDSDVPTLAKEADRLLGVITKLRFERGTPQPKNGTMDAT